MLSNFYWNSGSPPPGGVVDGCMGVGVGMGVGGCPMHTHTHTCTHMHARMHIHVKHANHAKHGCLHVSGHLQFLYMYTCVCMCVCVRARACACVGGHPLMPPDAPDTPPPTCPLPRAAGSLKQQKFNKS